VRTGTRILSHLAVAAFTVAAVVLFSVPQLPPRYTPWAPLDIREAPVTAVTALKFSRLERDLPMCRAALATADLRTTPLPHLASTKGCSVADAIRIEPSNAIFSSGFSASCPLSVAIAMFIRHVAQPAARRHFGTELVRVDHLGSFACRPIRGARLKNADTLSEHAAANAIDITGFLLADGRAVSVGRDWTRPEAVPLIPANAGATARQPAPTEEAAFLKDVRDGACRYFHTVLSPDYNAAHRAHFHFDMGRARLCR
jgi:hypothetical protein